MRLLGVFLLTFAWGVPLGALPPQEARSTTGEPAATAEPNVLTPQAEEVEAAEPSPADRTAVPAAEGEMAPAQVKELLHDIWLAEFRINDLLTEVRPERWKLSAETHDSFQHLVETLKRQLEAVEGWRGQLDARPESMYLAYQTYSAISTILPRLDGVARSMTQHENPSFGAQFSQAGNRLFDLQQTLGTYLGFLLRSQDRLLQALQSNLAACHTELSYAMRGKTERAQPMRNIRPQFKGRRVRERAAREAEKAKTSSPSNPSQPSTPGPK